MTTVYFIRHAESDHRVIDELTRPLSEKGLRDRALVTGFLRDKGIDAVLSSPYKRAVDTVSDFAGEAGLDMELIEDLRERRVDSVWIDDFHAFSKRQWADFSYKLSGGECLSQVQQRNIAALNGILARHKDKNIVIGTHGTALSTIIRYYDSSYGFDDFMAMVNIMPWVVKMYFDDGLCAGMQKIDLFRPFDKPDYDKCRVYTQNVGTLGSYRFVVVFARYQDRWLYCRAKTRDAFETAGGHIEMGETPLCAAKRELYEETGAVAYDIEPAFDYSVHNPSEYANGQVFFARIKELGNLPAFEMAEVKLFDAMPEKMRFPDILPVLYGKLQHWLNLQSAKDEIWDVYDADRRLTGRRHRRADPMKAGDYHLSVHVWLLNSKGQFLITKRAPNKGNPNMWACTGGAAVAGDDSMAAAIREVKEETGLDVRPENGKRLITYRREDSFHDVWLFRQNFDIKDVVLQENETVDAKYASEGEIREMIRQGTFIAYRYLEDLFRLC